MTEVMASRGGLAPRTGAPATRRGPPPFAGWQVGGVAGLLLTLLLVFVPWYGFHRDEFYFRLLSKRLSAQYMDLGPVTPLLVRGTRWLFGDNRWAMGVPAAVFAAGTVLVVALLTREFGGGRGAQLLAAAGTAGSVFPVTIGHTLLTSSLDVPLVLLAVLAATRALLRDRPGYWIVAGAICGIALLNKQVVLLVAFGLLAGLLIAGPRRVLRERWVYYGLLAAVFFGAPQLIFQAVQGFPIIRLRVEDGSTADRLSLLPTQFVLVGVLLLPVVSAGLVGVWRNPAWRPVRALVLAYPVCLLVVLAFGGRGDYLVPVQLTFLAAGCVCTMSWLGARRGRQLLTAAAFGGNAVLASVIALPVVPSTMLADTPIPQLNQVARDTVGWPRFAAQVSDVYTGLPERERSAAMVFTGNYGEAGALDFYRDRYPLPTVYSGHLELSRWGPPNPAESVVIAVGERPSRTLVPFFGDCRVADRIESSGGVRNEEVGVPVTVCRDRREPWPVIWHAQQHLD